MNKFTHVLVITVLGIALPNYAMEDKEPSELVIAQAVQQRKELNEKPKEENFGDTKNTVLDISQLVDQCGKAKKKEKKVKKDKKEKKKKNEASEDLLARLEAGVDPQEIDAAIIAKLKIYKGDITPESELVLHHYLEEMRNKDLGKYNDFELRILEKGTKLKRGLFTPAGSPEIQELQNALIKIAQVQESQNACNQLIAESLKSNSKINAERAQIQARQLKVAEESSLTQEKQLDAAKESNDNQVAGYKLNKKYYIYAGTATALAFLLNLGVSIGAYYK